jgi:hypothetical protein
LGRHRWRDLVGHAFELAGVGSGSGLPSMGKAAEY